MAGILYVVSTPIGNLADTSKRAVDVLRESDTILAEDTRRARILLKHYGIEARDVRSFHKHNSAARTEEACALLAEGRDLSLMTDSGTPLVSDPGLRLVRAALDLGARVVPVPGASAVLAALVASGLDPQPFTFYGFLPRSGRDRRESIARLAALTHTAVLFESPRRLVRTLEDLAAALGHDRRVAVARELTKVHEEFARGTLEEVAAYYREREPRGEVVICLAGASPAAEEGDEEAARDLARTMLRQGASSKEIVRALRARHGIERNRAYALALDVSEEVDG